MAFCDDISTLRTHTPNVVVWQPRDPDTFPFIVLGNKVDMEEQRVVDADMAKAWCCKNGNIPFFEVRAGGLLVNACLNMPVV